MPKVIKPSNPFTVITGFEQQHFLRRHNFVIIRLFSSVLIQNQKETMHIIPFCTISLLVCRNSNVHYYHPAHIPPCLCKIFSWCYS